MTTSVEKTNKNFVHRTPTDLRSLLNKEKELLKIWNQLTPLARNEWTCYVTIVKKEATRKEHLKRFAADLRSGQRRPCCWPGCPHRRPSAQKWFSPKIKLEK